MTDDDWITAASARSAERGSADRHHPAAATRSRLRPDATHSVRRRRRPAPGGGRDLPASDEAMPPLDDVGVCVEAAFMSYCSLCRVIDAIKVGDWLLHNQHMDLARLLALAVAQPVAGRRPGGDVDRALPRHRARSMKESETRAILEFGGLPVPRATWSWASRRTSVWSAISYTASGGRSLSTKGPNTRRTVASTPATSIAMPFFASTTGPYVQVTKEHMAQPEERGPQGRQALRRNGYDGPPPLFGQRWEQLFRSLRAAVGPGSGRTRALTRTTGRVAEWRRCPLAELAARRLESAGPGCWLTARRGPVVAGPPLPTAAGPAATQGSGRDMVAAHPS